MYKQIRVNSEALRRFSGLCAISFAILPGAMSAVHAAEWRFEPVLRVAGEFVDNPFLSIRTDVDKNESGYIAEGSVKIAYGSEKTKFDITPKVRSSDYGKDSELSSDDQFLRLNFGHDTESTEFRFRANYERESVWTAERADTDLDIGDPDDIPADDSGRVAIQDRRERFRLNPSFLYRTSGVSSLTLGVDFNDVRYDEAFSGFLTDYTDTRANASYRRTWSPRNTVILTGTYRSFETSQGHDEASGAGLTVGVDRQVSETSRLRVTAGFENNEVEDGGSDINWVGDVSFVQRGKTTALLAQYRHSISASGAGSLGTRDSVNLNFTRRLSDRISAGIGARIYSTDHISEDETTSINERDYVQLRAQFTWHLSKTWSLETNYRYTFIDRKILGESANSSQVTVWLNYRPTPMIRSR